MTVYETVLTIAGIGIVLLAFCGLIGFSPSRLWHRARGIDPYAGASRSSRHDAGEGDLGGGDSGGGVDQ